MPFTALAILLYHEWHFQNSPVLNDQIFTLAIEFGRWIHAGSPPNFGLKMSLCFDT